VVVKEDDDGAELFAGAVRSLGNVRGIGIGARTWGETVLHLRETLPRAEFVNATPLVNVLRRVKSPLELEIMTEACRIADEAMVATAPKVQPGVTTIELGEEVEHQMRVRGSRTPSFPTHIFTFGRDDSRDSTTASGTEPVRDGEAVMFDFGAVHRGYCSDFGRTVVCGEAPPEYDRVYDVMLAAQEAGRAAAVPTGMTFTDEPSILWPGHFGVRIEDIVACAEGGGRRLNALAPRV
jgi:Xaa-Pro aminopeptidase